MNYATCSAAGAHTFLPLEITVIAEPYFEEGELAAKFTMTRHL